MNNNTLLSVPHTRTTTLKSGKGFPLLISQLQNFLVSLLKTVMFECFFPLFFHANLFVWGRGWVGRSFVLFHTLLHVQLSRSSNSARTTVMHREVFWWLPLLRYLLSLLFLYCELRRRIFHSSPPHLTSFLTFQAYPLPSPSPFPYSFLSRPTSPAPNPNSGTSSRQ